MRVFQIYFDPSQIDQLEPGYDPYFNEKCTLFFESEVIRDLIERGEHKRSEYFGVVSYKFRQKLGYMRDNWKNNKNIANTSVREFTTETFEELLYQFRPDAMSFQRHAPHDPVMIANGFHPNFRKYWEEIMTKIGYKWEPVRIENVFYCNYFVAKSDLYERYVNEMLGPAMEVMKQMPELMSNSRYPLPWPKRLEEQFGVPHWTYHAFICERMFSYFAHIHNFKCLHY